MKSCLYPPPPNLPPGVTFAWKFQLEGLVEPTCHFRFEGRKQSCFLLRLSSIYKGTGASPSCADRIQVSECQGQLTLDM